MEILKLTADVNLLKERGYTFQKLFASNYKTYRKKIRDYTIWVWVKNSGVEIEDWYENTTAIVKFFKENYDKSIKENSQLPRPRSCMLLQLNRRTNELRERDMKKYFQQLVSQKFDEDEDDWREINLTYDGFLEVVKEYEFLTQKI